MTTSSTLAPRRICILGAGSWGLAVGLHLLRKSHAVVVWSHQESEARQLMASRRSSRLPQVTLPTELQITSHIEQALRGADAVLFVTPAQVTAEVARQCGAITPSQIVINLSKGIEKNTLRRMSEVLVAEIPGVTDDNYCALSGPSHAEEVAVGLPTTVVAASRSERVSQWVQESMSSPEFRVYRSEDVVGVELGGAVKNIIAIAAGISQALELGDNAQGALVTRGLAEMSRLGCALGANPLTFAGLSGIGDLVTTCFSRHSRNRKVGEMIGRGERLEDILVEIGMVAEGVDTCVSVRQLAARLEVETPITEAVFQTLFVGKPARTAVRELMGRTLKEELWRPLGQRK